MALNPMIFIFFKFCNSFNKKSYFFAEFFFKHLNVNSAFFNNIMQESGCDGFCVSADKSQRLCCFKDMIEVWLVGLAHLSRVRFLSKRKSIPDKFYIVFGAIFYKLLKHGIFFISGHS